MMESLSIVFKRTAEGIYLMKQGRPNDSSQDHETFWPGSLLTRRDLFA